MPDKLSDEQARRMSDEQLLQRIAKALDEGLGGQGFCLLLFPLDSEGGRIAYVSNADRDDMLTAMREFIARHEGRVSDVAGHA